MANVLCSHSTLEESPTRSVTTSIHALEELLHNGPLSSVEKQQAIYVERPFILWQDWFNDSFLPQWVVLVTMECQFQRDRAVQRDNGVCQYLRSSCIQGACTDHNCSAAQIWTGLRRKRLYIAGGKRLVE
jgi:hypothetical protein